MPRPIGQFKLEPFRNASGSESYRVSGTTSERKRIRKNFASYAEAIAEKQRLEVEGANLPQHAGLQRTFLSPSQLREAERFYDEAKDRSLLVVWKFFQDNYREPISKKLLPDALEEFIAAKTKANRRAATIVNLKSRVGFLVRAHKDKHVHEILPQHVAAVVHRAGLSPSSRDNERRALSSFFASAVKAGYCQTNPAALVDAIDTERDEPEILSLDAVKELLRAAKKEKGGAAVPYLALALFGAIRPTEIHRLTWADIDLGAGVVTIGGKAAKLRQRRGVKLHANAIEWLKPHRNKTPMKCPRKVFERVQARCGYRTPDGKSAVVKPWPHDVLRHTGISYHLAKWQHEGQTALWAGNSPDVIHRHYRGTVKEADVEKFWAISPRNITSR